jgi:SAM-dependent methyltransferase
MLARARDKVPEGTFHEADLHALPLADDSVDLVACAIALSHVPDLDRALRELVRVLRPHGHLVVSDSRGLIGDIGFPLVRVGPGGEAGYMPVYPRLASDYLADALPLGLEVRRCEEPRRPSPRVRRRRHRPARWRSATGARPRRAAEHLVAERGHARCYERGMACQPRGDHLALPARFVRMQLA